MLHEYEGGCIPSLSRPILDLSPPPCESHPKEWTHESRPTAHSIEPDVHHARAASQWHCTRGLYCARALRCMVDPTSCERVPCE